MCLIVNTHGETYQVIMETTSAIYFYDEYDRWCFFLKSEEGLYFEYVKENEKMHVWDFMKEFTDELQSQLESDEARWGNTWLKRVRGGQEARIESDINNYFDQYRNAGTPVPWLKIAGLAMIAWIRENHPELWDHD